MSPRGSRSEVDELRALIGYLIGVHGYQHVPGRFYRLAFKCRQEALDAQVADEVNRALRRA